MTLPHLQARPLTMLQLGVIVLQDDMYTFSWCTELGSSEKNSPHGRQLSQIQRMLGEISFPGRRAEERVGF